MNAKQIMSILNKTHCHGILHMSNDGTNQYTSLIVYVEDDHLRYWSFDHNNNVEDTWTKPAPNGEFDLLAQYADDVECYGVDGLRANDGSLVLGSFWI